MKIKKTLFFIVVYQLVVSCSYFKQEAPAEFIARVNNTFLLKKDLQPIQEQATGKEDSAQIVNNYINKWATQQLLIDQAGINLSPQKLEEFEKLIQQYKVDLYTEAYKSNIVATQLDSTFTKKEIESYYDNNKENFKLNDELFKLRFIVVGKKFSDVNKISERLNRFNEKDIQFFDKTNIQFKSFNFNDSTWVKKDQLLQTLPILVVEEQNVLKKSNFAQLQDSLDIYLIKIVDKLERNDIIPLSFVQPTIEQIILNKRKQELIHKLEKDIATDATRKKTFEIYNNQ